MGVGNQSVQKKMHSAQGPPSWIMMPNTFFWGENKLKINIWKPQKDPNPPVLIWEHRRWGCEYFPLASYTLFVVNLEELQLQLTFYGCEHIYIYYIYIYIYTIPKRKSNFMLDVSTNSTYTIFFSQPYPAMRIVMVSTRRGRSLSSVARL